MCKNWWGRCLIVLTLLATVAPTAHSQVPPPQGQAGQGLEVFDALMAAQLRGRLAPPGAALALLKNGRLILIRGYGYADRDRRTAVEPDTAFGLGSVSKTFTAVAVLHLVDQGKLSLDDRIFPFFEPIAAKIARFDPRIRDVTVRMLLNHSSGFERDLPESQDLQPDQQVRLALSRPLLAPAQSRVIYSNLGYVLLGFIVARISGESYESYLRKQVFKPMGIKGAVLPGAETVYRKAEARRYSATGGLLPPLLEPAPATGGWAASAQDLARFMRSLYGPKSFLSHAVFTEMTAAPSERLIYPSGRFWSLGWEVAPRAQAGFCLTKNGELAGVHAEIGHLASGEDFVVLFNGGGKTLAPTVSRKIMELIRRQQRWPSVDFFQ